MEAHDLSLRFQPSQKDVFSYFEKTTTKTKLDNLKRFQTSLDIIQKSQYIRSTEEEEFLASVIKDFNFFDVANNTKADKDILRLSRVFKHEYFPAGTPIVHKDDPGDKLYLVINGQAIAFVEIFQDHLQNAVEASPRAPSNEFFTSEPSSPMIPQSPGKSPTFNRGFSGFADEVALFNKTEKAAGLFQPKLTKKQTLSFQTQFSFNKPVKEFSRDHPPEAIWDVNKAINLSFAGRSRQEVEDDPQEIDDDYLDMLFGYKLLEEISETAPGKYIKDGYFRYKPAKTLSAGDYFGELALINNKPRSATVVACRDVHCLSLTKKDYQDVTMRSLETINPNIRFLKEFFPEATKINLAKIAYSLTEHHLNYNNKIYEEGDFPDAMYFIKQGEVQLVKIMNTEAFELAVIAGRKKRCTITTIGKGEVLGEDEVLFEREREYTAIVASRDVVVLKLSKRTYDALTDSYKMLFNNIRMLCKMKNQFRNQQKSQAQKLAENFKDNKLNEVNEEQESQCRALGKSYTRLSVHTYRDPPELLCVSPKRRLKGNNSSSVEQPNQESSTHKKEKLALNDYNTGFSKDFLKVKYYNETTTPSTATTAENMTRPKLQLKRRPKDQETQPAPGEMTINRLKLKKYLTDQQANQSKSKLSTFYTSNTSADKTELLAISPKNVKTMTDDYSFNRIHGVPTPARPSTSQKPNAPAFKNPNMTLGIDYSTHCVRKSDRTNTLKTDFSVSSFEDDAFDGRMRAIDEQFFTQNSARRLARPPTTGGYYCAKRFTATTTRSTSPKNNMKCLTGRHSGMQKEKEQNKSLDQGAFAIGLLSVRQRIGLKMGSDGNFKVENIKPKINTLVESEKKFENIHVKKTIKEYFEGFQEKSERKGPKSMISSPHSMFRKKTSKGHLRERYPLNKFEAKTSLNEDSLKVNKVQTK